MERNSYTKIEIIFSGNFRNSSSYTKVTKFSQRKLATRARHSPTHFRLNSRRKPLPLATPVISLENSRRGETDLKLARGGVGDRSLRKSSPLPPRNPDRLAAIGTRNLTEPLVSMDRYFVSNRTWNITTLGLLYRGRVGLSAVWVLTGATYVQRLEKFLIGLWSKKKRKKSFQRGFKQFYPKRVHARK